MAGFATTFFVLEHLYQINCDIFADRPLILLRKTFCGHIKRGLRALTRLSFKSEVMTFVCWFYIICRAIPHLLKLTFTQIQEEKFFCFVPSNYRCYHITCWQLSISFGLVYILCVFCRILQKQLLFMLFSSLFHFLCVGDIKFKILNFKIIKLFCICQSKIF